MLKSKKEKIEKEKLKAELNAAADETAGSEESLTEAEVIKKEADEKKISELESQLNNYKDLLLRKAAEFENYKKRTDSEISGIYRYAGESLMLELLPVLEDFNRLHKSLEDVKDIEPVTKGLELVFEKFVSVLNKQGLKEMDVLNKPFDVNLHEAIMQVPSKDAEPNTVTGVIENGYYLKDKVLKHAKVIVTTPEEKENG